ncbi:hypothetical protein BDN72DRAFT_831189 [Pluteus cervinus]|uniref:Uncharacterized protein n=1 Tax=Pluteus cervinus TaxID=181527 RepID=A0ACD3BG18_9AGAR|nr:hypothetical protein BDN72DRAFT_831189 [Pluteus cervinus]
MSPRASSSSPSSITTRSAAAPYSRRPAGQPKSSRQQFSACGACRMRRVRCDLKDLPMLAAGPPHQACSNCKERGLKCVDEFADVKAVKLLRRGRRLQQVEAIYGKAGDKEMVGSTSTSLSQPQSSVPKLSPDFFSSAFWRWFSIQHPILDSDEFPARYYAHIKDSHPLGVIGNLLAMILVIWAASFGFNERGQPESNESGLPNDDSAPDASHDRRSSHSPPAEDGSGRAPSRRVRKERTDAMVRELLELVDFYGVLRKPTWDGVRLLLLLIPLVEDISPLERLALHEAALSQAQAICTPTAAPPSPSSTHGLPNAPDDAVIRARIFWYAYIRESVITGMKGGRFILDGDDLEMFQRTLPPFGFGVANLPSPTTSSFPTLPSSAHGGTSSTSMHFTDIFGIPLKLASICRKVHTVLVGAKATRMAESGIINSQAIYEIWAGLDKCWDSFEALRRGDITFEGGCDIDHFASAWQIFIFECHNVIRESLRLCLTSSGTLNGLSHPYPPSPSSRPSSQSSNAPADSLPQRLHSIANHKCYRLLPKVIRVMKGHLSSGTRSALFQWDSGLVRDGCFFAGLLSATIDGEIPDDERYRREGDGGPITGEEGVCLSLSALEEMKWAFSNSEERQNTISMAWRGYKPTASSSQLSQVDYGYNQPPVFHPGYNTKATMSVQHLPVQHSGDRSSLTPLAMHHSPQRPGTGHSVYSDGPTWGSYTPPGTGNSVATNGTRGSPVFAHGPASGSYTRGGDDTFYHTSDIDQFHFTAPVAAPLVASHSGEVAVYSRASSSHGPPPSYQPTAAPYIDAQGYTSTGPAILASGSDIHGCAQFSDSCQPYYPSCPKVPSC